MTTTPDVTRAVLISQTCVTASIITLLTLGYLTVYSNNVLFYGILLYDIFAIVAHMLYRAHKKTLTKITKNKPSTTLIHIITSSCALLLSLIIGSTTQFYTFVLMVLLWTLSLTSGYALAQQK